MKNKNGFENLKRLSEMPAGGSGKVEKILPESKIRARLTELGFNHGERVECIMVSPLGDPRGYLVCNAVVALRCDDAMHILYIDEKGDCGDEE